MRPIPTQATNDPATILRHVWCQSYSTCLDRALVRGWPNWHCLGCKDYMRPAWTPEQIQEDSHRCRFLWAQVEHVGEKHGKACQSRIDSAVAYLLDRNL